MRFVLRSVPVIALVLALGAARVAAQQVAPQNDDFRWWLGGGGGVSIYSSQLREGRGVPTAGASLMIKAKKTGLLIGFEEAFNRGSADTAVAFGHDSTGAQTANNVTYHDLRKIFAALMIFPFHSAAQPYFGAGFGIMQVVNPQLVSSSSPLVGANLDSAAVAISQTKSFGFFTGIGGINLNVGPLTAYGQYQFTSAPPSGQMLRGATHTFTAGLRVNLGKARESLTGGGY